MRQEDKYRASTQEALYFGDYEVSSLSFCDFSCSIIAFTTASSTEAANNAISIIFFDNKTFLLLYITKFIIYRRSIRLFDYFIAISILNFLFIGMPFYTLNTILICTVPCKLHDIFPLVILEIFPSGSSEESSERLIISQGRIIFSITIFDYLDRDYQQILPIREYMDIGSKVVLSDKAVSLFAIITPPMI